MTENHIHIKEAEPSIGEFHSSGTADAVEQVDEGQREHRAAQASHPPWTRASQLCQRNSAGECPAQLITANEKPGEKTQALREGKDESL